MRRYSWFFFCISMLCAEESYKPLINLEGETGAIVAGRVNVITGDLIESSIDLSVPCSEPLYFHRLFISADGQWDNVWGAWEHNFMHGLLAYHHTKLIHDGPKFKQAVFRDEGGASIRVWGDTDESKTLHFKISKDGKGLTNVGRGIISGRTNLMNTALTFGKDYKSALLTNGSGVQRYFVERWFDGQKKTYYDEKFEQRPSGYKINYDFKDDTQHVYMTTTNVAREVGRISIKTPKADGREPMAEIRGSNGERALIHFRPTKCDRGSCKYTISRVEKPGGVDECYSYHDKSFRLKEKRSGHSYSEIDYFVPGDNYIGPNYLSAGQNESVYILKGKFEEGRVRAIYEPCGSNGEKRTTYRFNYVKGLTECYDALGRGTIYHYSEDNRLTKIARLHGTDKTNYNPSYIETLHWGNKQVHQDVLLMARVCQDVEEGIYLGKSYNYDSRGNVTTEKTWGNFTGTNNERPFKRKSEYLVKEMTYSDHMNLILTEKEVDGLQYVYTYLPYTDLVSSKLTLDKGIICRRIFNRYDEENCLIETIEDDGVSKEGSNLLGVNVRRINRFCPKKSAPCFGFPQESKELVLNLQTGQEELISRKTFEYNAIGKVTRQEVYDATNQFCYALESQYDALGNCTFESRPDGSLVMREFDHHSNCLKEVGPDPRKMRIYTYDAMNRLVKEVDESGLVTTHTYDLVGNRISTCNPYGHLTHFKYDDFNRLIETTYPQVDGQTVTTSQKYDMLSRLIVKRDGKGNEVRTKFTAHNKPYEILYPDGTIDRFLYDKRGNLLEATSRLGAVTRYSYDTFGRELTKEIVGLSLESCEYSGLLLVKTIDPLGISTTFSYDAAGRVVSTKRGNKRTAFSYDALGRRNRIDLFEEEKLISTSVQEFDFLGRVIYEAVLDHDGSVLTSTAFLFDEAGNQIQVKKGDSVWDFSFDSKGRKTLMVDPLGNETRTDYFEQESVETENSGHKTLTFYDPLGRVSRIQKVDPFGEILQESHISYDASNQKVLIENGPQSTKFEYDSLNRPTVMIRGYGTTLERKTKISYNPLGQKELVTKPDGVTLHYSYDTFNRLISLKSSDNTISYLYHYNERTELVLVEDLIHNTVEKRTYSEEGFLASETLQTGHELSYSYDAMGRLKEMVLPDQSMVNYSYNALSLTAINRNGYTHSFLSYDNRGNLKEAKLLGNAGTISYGYDALNRPTFIKHKDFSEESISYDSRSNMLGYNIVSPLESYAREFSYDGLNQLQSERGGPFSHNYLHDNLHNRLKKDETAYGYNSLNELNGYQYDLNGNISAIDGLTELKYDALDRLIAVKKGEETIFFTYDSSGRRLSKRQNSVVHYIYFNENEICSIVDGKIHELRLLGQGLGAEIGAAVAIEIDSVPYAPIHDHAGNITALIDADGKVQELIHYSAFGETSQKPLLTPWTYSSKRLDIETGWIFFGRRYYIPSLGRFASCDPKGLDAGPNPYSYVENRPLTLHDLYGLISEALTDEISGYSSPYLYPVALLGYSISKFGEHIATFPIIRDLISATGRFLQGHGWSFNPHYTTARATVHILGDPTTAKEIVVSINGILTTREDVFANGRSLKREDNCVVMVHSTNHGFIPDLVAAGMNWLGYDTSSCLTSLEKIREYQNLRPDLMVRVIAHSRGTLVLDNVLQRLTEVEKSNLDLCGVGGYFIPSHMAGKVCNFRAHNDPVPLILNCFNIFKACFGYEFNLISEPSNTSHFESHSFMSETYQKCIQRWLDKTN